MPLYKLETEELENRNIKVNMDFILKLRAEAERQKVQRDAKKFAKMLGDDGKDFPDFRQESVSELDKIADSFEIIEE